jgi:hypothetical protein
MKVLAYNFSARNGLHGTKIKDFPGGKALDGLPGVNARENTIISATESYFGITGKDSVFL